MARTLTFVIASAIAATPLILLAQPEKPAKQPDKPQMPQMPEGFDPAKMDPKAMMEAWAKMNAPGPEHAVLEPLAGTWDTTVKSWMGPGEPNVSHGKSTNEWILDKHYMLMRSSGEMMGAKFEGISQLGYNKTSRKYESTWSDNYSTQIMLAYGTYDDAKKELTFNGSYDDPFGSGKREFRNVTRIVDTNTHVFEMYESMMPGEPPMKVLEITYKRTGAAPGAGAAKPAGKN